MARKINPWVQFVRLWAKHTNQTYGCALSNPKTREAYYRHKADPGGVENKKAVALIKIKVAKEKAAKKK